MREVKGLESRCLPNQTDKRDVTPTSLLRLSFLGSLHVTSYILKKNTVWKRSSLPTCDLLRGGVGAALFSATDFVAILLLDFFCDLVLVDFVRDTLLVLLRFLGAGAGALVGFCTNTNTGSTIRLMRTTIPPGSPGSDMTYTVRYSVTALWERP